MVSQQDTSCILINYIHGNSPFHYDGKVEEMVYCEILPAHTGKIELQRKDTHSCHPLVNCLSHYTHTVVPLGVLIL